MVKKADDAAQAPAHGIEMKYKWEGVYGTASFGPEVNSTEALRSLMRAVPGAEVLSISVPIHGIRPEPGKDDDE